MNSPTHRITITAAALALLTFTACSSPENSQPDKTSAPASTPAATSAPNTPTATPEPSQTNAPDTSSTPTASATTEPPADKTTFAGTTALGENVTFEFLNSAVSGTGLKGSWGALCSTDATANQLSGYTIQTTEDSGQGHLHQWNNIRGEATKLAPTKLDQTEITNILEYTAGHVENPGECMTIHTELSSAAQQGYPSAEIGQYYGGELHNVTELN